MFRYIASRVLLLIPTFIGISFVAFMFIRLLPGDPVIALAGERGMTPERHQMLLEQFGFNRPIWEQYFSFLWNIFHGDFGTSIASKRAVLADFLTLFPATLELSICAMLFAVIIGIPAGIFAAVKRGSIFDQLSMGIALVGYSMPIFWWGILLIILF
ncbi:ABC transporter permease subunit, partial [Escherichia coli]|nr:ABC transporter permease subunit [Escherichia coli]